jgi:hypothetical protein
MNIEEQIHELQKQYPSIRFEGREEEGFFSLSVDLNGLNLETKTFIAVWFANVSLEIGSYTAVVDEAHYPLAMTAAKNNGLKLVATDEPNHYRVLPADDTQQLPTLEGED